MPKSTVQKAALAKARAAAQAKLHASLPPTPTTPSVEAQLQQYRAKSNGLHLKLESLKRSTRAKIRTRDKVVNTTKDQLSKLTAEHMASLQSLATLQESYNGVLARLGVLSNAYPKSTDAHTCALKELEHTRHLLKMSQSDLLQSQDHGRRAQDRVKELTHKVCLLRAKAKLSKSKDSTSGQATPVFKVKEKGAVPLSLRVTILKLVSLGIGTKHVMPAIECVSDLFHVQLKGRLSAASVRNIIHEGGVAAHLQIAQAMHESTDSTISSDSTSHKSINYVAKHYTVTSPDPGTQPRRFALPITTIDGHSSQDQLEDWIQTLRFLANMYRDRFEAPVTAEFWREFVSKLRGMMTDHANDQKLMIQLFTQWKRELEREARGSKHLSSLLPLELLELMAKALADNGKELTAWSTLSQEEQVWRTGATFRKLCLSTGEAEFQRLLPKEQFKVDLFIWAGCCMHKSLNAAHAGFEFLAAMWPLLRDNNGKPVPGPIPLLNKDNAAVLDHGTAEEQERVLASAKGGAYKLLELLGALLKKKDDKKGQQDWHKLERLRALGESLSFLDVSNTRFAEFLYAAAKVISNLPFYQEYLKLVHDAKAKQSWTNLERNCAVTLMDIPTLTELCAASIYLVVVEKSYIKRVRGGKEQPQTEHAAEREKNGQPARKRSKKKSKPKMVDENILDLAAFHKCVVDYCKGVADDPDALLVAGYPTTFEGEELDADSRVIIDAVHRISGNLPHLKDAIGAFFRGAHEKWVKFTAEFAQDAQIASLSVDQRRRAFLNTTNDVNEGALGMLRIALRRSPNISLFTYNSLMMIRQNNVAEFFASLDTAGPAFVRDQARRMAHGSIEKQRRLHLAEKRFAKAQQNTQAREDKERKAKEKKTQEDAEMRGVKLESDTEAIRALKGQKLALQIKWHQRNKTMDPETRKKATAGMSKLSANEKRERLVELAAFAAEGMVVDEPEKAPGAYKV